jgi:hypothetical protein
MQDFTPEEAMAELARRQEAAPSEAESAIRGGFDTLTFGAAPKASAAIGAGLIKLANPDSDFTENYAKGRDYLRQQNAIAAQENPWSYFGGGLVGGTLNPLARGANTVTGAAIMGAAYGGAYGLGSSDTGDVGTLGVDNFIDAAQGAAFGGAFGAGAQRLVNAAVPGFNALARSKYNPLNSMRPDIPTEPGTSMVPQGMPTSNPNLNPISQKALNLSNQFNVPLTKGQASQDLSQQTLEDLLASGAKGSDAANIMNAARQQGNESFQAAAQNLRKDIGGGEFIEKGKSLQGLVDNIVTTAKSENQAVKQAYDIAKDNVGYLNLKDVQGFNKVANAKLVEEGLTTDNAPAAYNQLKAFNKIFTQAPKGAKEVDFKRIEAFRQGLNRSYKSAQGQDKYGIGLLKGQFDDYLDDTIETALVRGNSSVLDQFKDARSLAAKYKQNYSAKDKSEFGKKFVQDIVDNANNSREPYTYSMISDKIFGANKYGFKPQAIGIVNEIKNRVGADTPEYTGLKLDAVQKVIRPLLNQKGEVNFNGPSIQTYKNNLKDNESFLKVLLPKEELKQLYDLGDLGSLMYQSRKSVGNPSQSGIVKTLTELPFIQKALGIPFVNKIPEAYGTYQAKAAINQQGLEKGLQALSAQSTPMPNTKASAAASGSANALIHALSTSLQRPEFSQEEALKEIERRNANKTSLETPSLSQTTSQTQPQPQAQAPQNDLVNKIAYVESGGNPNAKSKTSTASGLFQFTNGTWKDVVDKYGARTGITYKDKNNPQAQRIMAELNLADNGQALEKTLGRTPYPAEVYLTHFLGLEGAKKILAANPNRFAASVLPEAAKANRSIFFDNGRPLVVAEVYQNARRRLQKAKS